MDLAQIKEFNHKIKKINITNKNTDSIYDEVIVKIALDVPDDETVRFSLEYNDKYIHHQSINNDYFVRIPNKLRQITELYAHFFIADLYEYEESTEILAIYDLSALGEDTTGTYNDKPTLQISSHMYDMIIGDDKKPYIRSLLHGTNNDIYKNPNYKNYTNTDVQQTISDMTEQGMFPLSSRYRSQYAYLNAPTIPNSSPYWHGQLTNIFSQCNNLNNRPFWEAKIHRSQLSLDAIDLDSLNVYLNYQYLPTSTEYHQHLFGFESDITTKNFDFNVFEGTNINKVNADFGSDNNYRLVNYGNVFDDKCSMFVDHTKHIDINFIDFVNNAVRCNFKKNSCHNYFTYTPLGTNNYCVKHLKLKADTEYVLKYYIYIPVSTNAEMDSCYIQVESDIEKTIKEVKTIEIEDEETGETITDTEEYTNTVTETIVYKIDTDFLQQDKILRHQWIYHEVPFTGANNVKIKIIGPQHNNTDDIIHFYGISIDENIEYSPTIKYTKKGIYLTENDKYTFRSIGDPNDTCVSISTNNIPKWTPTKSALPTPIGNIHFLFSDDINVYYDDITSNLIYNGPNFYSDNNHTQYKSNMFYGKYQVNYDTGDSTLTFYNTNDTKVTYNSSNGTLSIQSNKSNKKRFTQGTGNWFTLGVQDNYNQPITIGTIECAIFGSKETDLHAAPLKYIGKKTVNHVGTVYFNNIDLSSLNVGDAPTKFYLRIAYTNDCYRDTVIDFRTIYVEKQNIYLKAYVNDNLVNTQYTVHSANDIPLKVELEVLNQLNNPINSGYCELSINDKIIQTTFIDTNGRGDFYLNFEDLPDVTNSAKIVYYDRFFAPIDWIYFDIIIPTSVDRRDAIPIVIKDIVNGIESTYTKTDYIIDNDDAIILPIDVSQHSNFRLEVYKNNNLMTDLSQNIIALNTDDILLVDTDINTQNITEINTYKIVTKSINTSGKYRQNEKIIKVIRRAKDIGSINIALSADTLIYNSLSDVATFTATVLDNRGEPVSGLLLRMVEFYNNQTNIKWSETDEHGVAIFYCSLYELATTTYYVHNFATTRMPYGQSNSITIPLKKTIIEQSINAFFDNRILHISFTNARIEQNILYIHFVNSQGFISLELTESILNGFSIEIGSNVDATITQITMPPDETDTIVYTGATKELKGPPASPIGAGTVITPLQPESLLMDKYKNVQKIDNNSGFIH